MFNQKTPPEKTGLEENIDLLLARLKTMQGDEDEYKKIVSRLTSLHALKEAEKPKSVSPDVMWNTIGSLAGIAIIVGHERTHVIASQALKLIKFALR